MDSKTLQDKIAVMQAAAEGKTIECRQRGTEEWFYVHDPEWAWNITDYRIKPKPSAVIEVFPVIYRDAISHNLRMSQMLFKDLDAAKLSFPSALHLATELKVTVFEDEV